MFAELEDEGDETLKTDACAGMWRGHPLEGLRCIPSVWQGQYQTLGILLDQGDLLRVYAVLQKESPVL